MILNNLLRLLPALAKNSLRFYQLWGLFLVSLGLALPPDGLGFSLCLFFHTTGLPCPGCGMTRSLSSSLHLDLKKALLYHPLGPALALASLLFALSCFWKRLALALARLEPFFPSLLVAAASAVFVTGSLRLALLLTLRYSSLPLIREYPLLAWLAGAF